MNIMKKLAGIAVFLLALIAAIAVTRYYAPDQTPDVPADNLNASVPNAPPAPPVAPPSHTATVSTPVFHQVQLVTLDLANEQSHTTLVLERDASKPAPERVWVWTFFFVPGDGQGWASAPVEIRQPFTNGNRVTRTVTAECAPCGDLRAPKSGYYARVKVSSDHEEAARWSTAEMSRDIANASPVVVEAPRGKGR
ncbi:MAG TPA: hypothetical protein VF666_20860 [Pyrinomonadaceae bacterium]|jgi:hypothetical protein